jgi:hypothetical protein
MEGTPTLHNISRQMLSNLSKEEAIAYGVNHWNILQMIEQGDYLMPFIAQYDSRNPPSMEDTFWMANIKKMIDEETLYMIYIACSSWAHSDKEFEKNKHLIEENGRFKVCTPYGNEDAKFESINEVELVQVYFRDELVPNNPPTIKLKLSGLVEFGTQSIAKTAYALSTGNTLMRLPYKIKLDGLNPCFAVFHNTKPFNVFD